MATKLLVVDGDRGSRHLSTLEVDAMDQGAQADFANRIQQAIDQGYVVSVEEDGLGGLTITWRRA